MDTNPETEYLASIADLCQKTREAYAEAVSKEENETHNAYKFFYRKGKNPTPRRQKPPTSKKGAKRQPNGTKQLSRKAQRRANLRNPVTVQPVAQQCSKHIQRVPFKEREGSRVRNGLRIRKMFATLPEEPEPLEWCVTVTLREAFLPECSTIYDYPKGYWDRAFSEFDSEEFESEEEDSASDEEEFLTLDDLARSGHTLS